MTLNEDPERLAGAGRELVSHHITERRGSSCIKLLTKTRITTVGIAKAALVSYARCAPQRKQARRAVSRRRRRRYKRRVGHTAVVVKAESGSSIES